MRHAIRALALCAVLLLSKPMWTCAGAEAIHLEATQDVYIEYAGVIAYDIINDGDTPSAPVDPAWTLEFLRDGEWEALTPISQPETHLSPGSVVPPRDLLHTWATISHYSDGSFFAPGTYRIVQKIGADTYTMPFTIGDTQAYAAYIETIGPSVRLARQEAHAFQGAAWQGHVPRLWLPMTPLPEDTIELPALPGDGLPRAAVIAERGDENALCILRQAADGNWSVEASCATLLLPGDLIGGYIPYTYSVSEAGVDYCYEVSTRGPWDEGAGVHWHEGAWHVTNFFHYAESGQTFSYDMLADGSFSLRFTGDETFTGGSLFLTVAPGTFETSLAAFDREAAIAAANAIYASRNDPLWLLATGEQDILAAPQVIPFAKGQTYDVYTGPGKQYLRAAEGKAQVSTNGWIQVFGREGDWLMIQYNVDDYNNRVGYIPASALPRGTQVPELAFTRLTPTVLEGFITDDPVRNFWELAYVTADDANLVTLLGAIDGWSYVEYVPAEGAPVRGFIHTLP